MTTLRILPEDCYDRVMRSDQSIPKELLFEGIIKRFRDPATDEKAPMSMVG